MRQRRNNRRLRRPARVPAISNGPRTATLFTAGGQNYTVRQRITLAPTNPSGTTAYVLQHIINPYQVIVNSWSAPLITMFRQFRVNWYNINCWWTAVSSATPGFALSVLIRETPGTFADTNAMIDAVVNQPMHRRSRLNTVHRHTWRPVEPDDYNYEVINPDTTYDYGRLLAYVDAPNAPGRLIVEVEMSLTFVSRQNATQLGLRSMPGDEPSLESADYDIISS
jgi:hypothetical protein